MDMEHPPPVNWLSLSLSPIVCSDIMFFPSAASSSSSSSSKFSSSSSSFGQCSLKCVKIFPNNDNKWNENKNHKRRGQFVPVSELIMCGTLLCPLFVNCSMLSHTLCSTGRITTTTTTTTTKINQHAKIICAQLCLRPQERDTQQNCLHVLCEQLPIVCTDRVWSQETWP